MAKMLCFASRMFLILTFILPILHVQGKQNLVTLHEENWTDMLEGEWMVEFFAPWCPACKQLQPVWKEFSDWSKDLGIKVGQVDVTTSPGLSGRFMVTALPTIFHVVNGEFRQYRLGRDRDTLISFIEDKKWQQVEAVPGWKSPNSYQMSVVSWFFKLSTVLRAIHNQLLEDYGLPTWGSYLIFAVATIFVGAFLGLFLVCIIDCIYPPKIPIARSSTLSSLKEEHEEGDEGDDLIDEGAESGQESQDESQTAGDESQEDDDVVAEKHEEADGQSSPNMRKRRTRKAD